MHPAVSDRRVPRFQRGQDPLILIGDSNKKDTLIDREYLRFWYYSNLIIPHLLRFRSGLAFRLACNALYSTPAKSLVNQEFSDLGVKRMGILMID